MKLYDTLGVEKEASIFEIKMAYRKLAKIHHPDSGGDEEEFKKISEAYEVLSSPEKRKRYDETGEYGNDKPFESMFMSFVSEVVIPIIEKGMSVDCDLMGKIESVVEDVSDTGASKLKECHKYKGKIEEAITRLKHKGEGEDMVSQVMTKEVEKWSERIAHIESELVFLGKCKTELQKYEYKHSKTKTNKKEMEAMQSGMAEFLVQFSNK